MTYADLHFHILPGVDDGPSSMDESVALAAAAVADGTRTVVATPHVRTGFLTDVSELPDRVRELSDRLACEGIGLAVRRGAELGHDMVGRLSQAELDSVAHGPPGGRWLLVETPFVALDGEFTAATDELRDRGFAVVIAHPERARSSAGAVLRYEVERGSLLQVNAWSLVGRHGPEAFEKAHEMLRSGKVGLIASDAHGGRRQPALTLGVAACGQAGLSSHDAQRLVGAVPHRLLERGLAVPALAVAA
ncbi:MAG: protein-tyrosine phosphatase [Thermoleophilaceae bacterium]|jgi:protein-tyrosine phosphatase|nr:protein-tyrosine phosphatase [Thermoleophilaceae bacterium]MEA2436851.1 protein-tyrosine phosphatase [Thermoleophilaceae bacterium]